MKRAHFLRTMAFALTATALPEISFPHEMAAQEMSSAWENLMDRMFEEMWERFRSAEAMYAVLPDAP